MKAHPQLKIEKSRNFLKNTIYFIQDSPDEYTIYYQ